MNIIKFGRLTLIQNTGKKTKDNRYLYLYKCDCGGIIERTSHGITNGKIKSCGCLRKETARKLVLKIQHKAAKAASISNHKHGMRDTRFYRIWIGMKNRCLVRSWNKYYGAKGISVCKRWADFRNFMQDMLSSYDLHVQIYGEKNTSIDRIDVLGNYTPENCKWSTFSEQNKNQTRHPNRNSSGRFTSD